MAPATIPCSIKAPGGEPLEGGCHPMLERRVECTPVIGETPCKDAARVAPIQHIDADREKRSPHGVISHDTPCCVSTFHCECGANASWGQAWTGRACGTSSTIASRQYENRRTRGSMIMFGFGYASSPLPRGEGAMWRQSRVFVTWPSTIFRATPAMPTCKGSVVDEADSVIHCGKTGVARETVGTPITTVMQEARPFWGGRR